MIPLLFADEVAAALWTHLRRVDGAGGNVAAVADTISFGLPVHRETHLTIENDVGGEAGVRVVGIVGLRAILPDEGMREAFRT